MWPSGIRSAQCVFRVFQKILSELRGSLRFHTRRPSELSCSFLSPEPEAAGVSYLVKEGMACLRRVVGRAQSKAGPRSGNEWRPADWGRPAAVTVPPSPPGSSVTFRTRADLRVQLLLEKDLQDRYRLAFGSCQLPPQFVQIQIQAGNL